MRWRGKAAVYPCGQPAEARWTGRSAGGATVQQVQQVQQVREHLGHISLRAVERYLHNLPGAEAGAAGAVARVIATGALYPPIAPSYPSTTIPEAAEPSTTRTNLDPAGEYAPQLQSAAAAKASAVQPPESCSAFPAPQLVLALTARLTGRTAGSAADASVVIRIIDASASRDLEFALEPDSPSGVEPGCVQAVRAPARSVHRWPTGDGRADNPEAPPPCPRHSRR